MQLLTCFSTGILAGAAMSHLFPESSVAFDE